MADVDLLEEQRKRMFEALAEAGAFYDSNQNARDLIGMFMSQARGEAVPFTPTVVNAMMAQNADAGAQSFSAQRRQIQRGMANSGLTGSGLESSALADAMSRAQASTRAGRQQINSRVDLENFAARERAQVQAMAFVNQQAEMQRAAKFAEANYRSQMHATGSEQDVMSVAPGPSQGVPPPASAQAAAPAAPPRPTNFGTANATILQPLRTFQSPAINQGGLGMNNPSDMIYAQQVAGYQQALQNQQRDRSQLSMLQADWDRRYGMMGR